MTTIIPKLLIVDDNDVMRTLLRGLLRNEESFNIVGEARNGLAAIEMVERVRPDIVCLDVVMPEMDGLEALQEIKRMRPETVVIMVTGNASKENVHDALDFGAAGFVVKPFNAATVIDTISRAWQVAQRKARHGATTAQ